MKLEGLKINFLGDSITEGCGTNDKNEIYLNILKKEVNLCEARNYGISGTRYANQKMNENWNPYFDEYSFSQRFSTMNDDADVVVVFGGTNDYGHGNAPIGVFEDRTPDTFYGALHYVYSGLIKKYLGKPIIIMTPLHRDFETRPTGDNKLTPVGDLKKYVDIIREVAQYYSLPVLDLFSISGLQPEINEIKEKYMPDGLHPNYEGHKVIASKLKSFLEAL